MEDFKALEEIICDLPDVVLVEFVIFSDFSLCESLQVPSICVLHNNAESVIFFFKKCISVLDNVWRVNGCEEANLIEGIIFFFGAELIHLDLFDGKVLLSVFLFFDNFDNSSETTNAKLLDDLEFVHCFLFIEEKLFGRYINDKFIMKIITSKKLHT